MERRAGMGSVEADNVADIERQLDSMGQKHRGADQPMSERLRDIVGNYVAEGVSTTNDAVRASCVSMRSFIESC
jgi:hypothetical protein